MPCYLLHLCPCFSFNFIRFFLKKEEVEALSFIKKKKRVQRKVKKELKSDKLSQGPPNHEGSSSSPRASGGQISQRNPHDHPHRQ
jgi:hypothetical protein